MTIAKDAPPTRRIGAESSKTRAALLDAAQDLMREEGYAAVTSRKLADRAGLKPQLVHYYFQSMDDLFLALFERVAEELIRKQDMLEDTEYPMRTMWELGSNATDAILYVEFMAMANHRKSLRTAIAAFGDRWRQRQTARLTALIESRDLNPDDWKPVVLATMLEMVARGLGFEALLGMTAGREETLAAMIELTEQLDRAPPRPAPVAKAKRPGRKPASGKAPARARG